VIDLARSLRFADGVVAADHALRNGATGGELERAARRVRGLPSEGSVRRVLGFASDKAESPGESLARVAFDEHGLPAPDLGVPIHRDGELLGVVDFAWPDHGTVAEFDGRLKYLPDNDRGPHRLWHEKLREDRLRDAGLEVVRITWDDVTVRPSDVARRVRAAFARADVRRAAS